MSLIHTIHAAMLTRNTDNSGSDSPIIIIGNQLGVDKIQMTAEGRVREEGQAALFIRNLGPPPLADLPLETDFLSHPFGQPNRSYFRVSIKGGDFWRPQHFFLWGTAEGRHPVVPLALSLNLKIDLSTRARYTSFHLPEVFLGDNTVPIDRLLFVTLTSSIDNADTESDVRFTIQTPNEEMGFDVPRTPQRHLATGRANFYGPEFFPVSNPFSRGDLSANAIRLFIEGDDAWLPQALYLFGLGTHPGGQPNMVVPLVHLENEPVGWLSTDTGVGQPSVLLPLVG